VSIGSGSLSVCCSVTLSCHVWREWLAADPAVSVAQYAVALCVIAAATYSVSTNHISSDAYVGMIGASLGYVFGRYPQGSNGNSTPVPPKL